MGTLKKILIGAALLLLICLVLYSQTDTGDLEKRLPNSTGKERIEILLELAKEYSSKEPKIALTYANEARQLIQTGAHPGFQVRLFNAFAAVYTFQGEYDKGEKNANRSLALARESGDKLGHAQALYLIGVLNWRRGTFPGVMGPLEKSLEIFKDIDDSGGIAKCYNLMGVFYWKLNEHSLALEYFLKAGKIYEELEYKHGIALASLNSGLIHMDMGNYDRALEHYQKALEMHRQANNKIGTVTALNNIAVIYLEQQKYQEALDLFRETLTLNEQLDDKRGIAMAHINLGEVHEQMEQYREALDYYTRALKIFQSVNHPERTADVFINLGRLERKLGRLQEAQQHINRAIAIAAEINSKSQLMLAFQELTEILEAQKDHAAALTYFKKYKELNDSRFNEENSRKIAEAQTRFDVEKKESQIKLLKKEQEIQQLTLKEQQTLIRSIIVISVLVLVLAFVVYTRYRLKAKANLALKQSILEHQQTSEKLRESEEKFRALAEKSVAGIYIIQDGVFKYVNPRYLEIYGYSAEEVMGKNHLMTVFKEDHDLVEQNIRKRISGEVKAIHYQFRGITKTGEIKHVEIYGTRSLYEGRPAVLGTVVDMTDRKKAEAELLKSQKMESIGILAGGIAHDFNNLLTIIQGNISLAIADIKQDIHLRQTLKPAEETSKQAAELAHKLITFSRGGWLTPAKLSLSSILKSTMDYYPKIRPFLQEMEVDIPADLKPIYGDERQLRQVISNLLENARESMTIASPITIKARNLTLSPEAAARFQLPAGDYVRISFIDRGEGIPKDILQNIFDPYFSTKDRVTQKGLGLGLAICYSVVKRHQGHINVESTEGEGTTVNLFLPAFKENPVV